MDPIDPRLALQLEILRLPSGALWERLLQELQNNPGFEVAEDWPSVTPPDAEDPAPDAAVELTPRGDYDVRVLDDWARSFRVCPRLAELCANDGISSKDKEYLGRKIERVKWLLAAVEARRETLRKVVRAILQCQEAFLAKGTRAIKPLQLKTLAEDAKIPLQIARAAIDGKWVQTPHGLLPLLRFVAAPGEANGN